MQITADDVLRIVSIKGSVAPDQLTSEAAFVEELSAGGLLESAAGALRATARGKLKVGELFTTDRDRVGAKRANALLEEFHALDGRMKQIVTAWQIRDVNGEQTLNDHSDADYDARVLDQLTDLHSDTSAWLAPLSETLPRFGVYAARLGRALELAPADQRFVASPRVDSYHGVWFELHEDLIRLAGQKRSEASSG